MLPRVFAFAIAATAIACSSQVPFVQQGQSCDNDLQCQPPLVCRCIIVISTDDEGNDETVPGICEPQSFTSAQCPTDGGIADTTPAEDTGTAAETGEETASDAPTDGVTDGAIDSAIDSAIDTAIDTATDTATDTAPSDDAGEGG